MAQTPIIMAFRKRLGKRGYTGIHISRVLVDEPERGVRETYLVEALEPLAGMGVQCVMSEWQMAGAMR